MRSGWLTLVALAALSSCDGFGDGRVQRLEEEIRALRAAQAVAPNDIAAVMTPLRGALDVLFQRGEVERTRWTAVTQELAQLATLMQSFVDDGRRVEVEALRARVGDLERQAKEQAATQSEERDLVLRALESTATKLEAFLRQVNVRKSEAPPPSGGGELRQSVLQPAVLWPLGLLGLVAAALVLVSRRAPRRPRAIALDPPEAYVDAPAFDLADVPDTRVEDARPRGPVLLSLDIETRDLDWARQRIEPWLADEPRVLAQPRPELEDRDGVLRVRFFVPDTMPMAERACLTADVMMRGRVERHADRRSA